MTPAKYISHTTWLPKSKHDFVALMLPELILLDMHLEDGDADL